MDALADVGVHSTMYTVDTLEAKVYTTSSQVGEDYVEAKPEVERDFFIHCIGQG